MSGNIAVHVLRKHHEKMVSEHTHEVERIHRRLTLKLLINTWHICIFQLQDHLLIISPSSAPKKYTEDISVFFAWLCLSIAQNMLKST